MAVHEGLIHSMDDPVTRYVPEFSHTAWDGVTLHQRIRHTSAVVDMGRGGCAGVVI